MNPSKTIFAFFLLIIAGPVLISGQKTLTQTVTTQNKSCNSACSVLDVPELNGNPGAIIFVTVAEGAKNLDPHPIGAYFMYLKKWSIYNIDGAAMPEGARFNVQYYVSSAADRFVYVAPSGVDRCIDQPSLNGNPNIQIRVFPTSSPTRGALYDHSNPKIEYYPSVRKWCLSSSSGMPVSSETAYNISFSETGATNQGTASISQTPSTTAGPPAQTAMNTAGVQTTVVLPSLTLAPPPLAPLTVVARVQWPLPDQGNISLSPGYCRPIFGTYSNPEILDTDTATVTGLTVNQGNLLTWSATVAAGSLQLNVCNSQKASLGAAGALQITGRSVNILVVR
jgi:hypothetical protein